MYIIYTERLDDFDGRIIILRAVIRRHITHGQEQITVEHIVLVEGVWGDRKSKPILTHTGKHNEFFFIFSLLIRLPIVHHRHCVYLLYGRTHRIYNNIMQCSDFNADLLQHTNVCHEMSYALCFSIYYYYYTFVSIIIQEFIKRKCLLCRAVH